MPPRGVVLILRGFSLTLGFTFLLTQSDVLKAHVLSVEPLLWKGLGQTQKKSIIQADPTLTKAPIDFGEGQIPSNPPLTANQLGYPIAIDRKVSTEVVKNQMGWVREGHFALGGFSIRSEGAKALRLGLSIRSLPSEARLGFFSGDSRKGVWVSAPRILKSLVPENAPGPKDSAIGLYWSPIVEGETMKVVIRLPTTVSPDRIQFSVPIISHLYRVPTIPAEPLDPVPSSPSCFLDARCYPSSERVGRSAVNLVYTRGGSTFSCSATLLNNRRGDGQPFVVTAAHCIQDQASAENLAAYWFFTSHGCHQRRLNPEIQVTYHGAILLHQSIDMDFSFLRLNEMPPAGAVYAGWTTEKPQKGERLMGLHYPAGQPLKISFGQLEGFLTCRRTMAGSQDCDPSGVRGANYLQVKYHKGLTAQGSSGSGVFSNQGRYFRGNLFGSVQTCDKTGGVAAYSRFDRVYTEGHLDRWLNPAGRK